MAGSSTAVMWVILLVIGAAGYMFLNQSKVAAPADEEPEERRETKKAAKKKAANGPKKANKGVSTQAAPAPAPAPEPESEEEPEPVVAKKAPKKKAKKAKAAAAAAPAPAAAPADGKKKKKAKKAKEAEDPSKVSTTVAAAAVYEQQIANAPVEVAADDDADWGTVKAKKSKPKRAPSAAVVVSSSDSSVYSEAIDLGECSAMVIGKGGATIKQIQADSGAKVNIDKEAGSLCTISGDPANVAEARNAIESILRTAADRVSELVDLEDKVPAVIGKAGSVIKKIQLDSGARVDISREDGSCTVSGSAAQVAAAKVMIAACMAGPPPAEAAISIDVGRDGVHIVIGGAGGPTVRMLQNESGAKFDIERGTTTLCISGSKEAVEKGTLMVNALLAENAYEEVIDVDDQIGAVIGTGGLTIRDITAQSGARLNTSKGNFADLVTISGTRQQVAKAKAMVEEIVRKATAGPEAAPGHVMHTEDVGNQVGSIIGQQGKTVKQLQADSGAKIEFGRGTSICYIHGPAEAVEKAKAAVDAILEKNREFERKKAEREAKIAANLAALAAARPDGGDDDELEEGEIKDEGAGSWGDEGGEAGDAGAGW
jgi:rRNA processing protein Krr1/Pno1